jgi:hypothetical protein
MSLIGCNQSGNEIVKIVEERDSLRMTLAEHHSRLKSMNEMISTINLALDSISTEEGLLFVSPSEEFPINRDDALKNLERFEMVVRHQQEKINRLQKSILKDTVSGNLKGLIDHMKLQLQEKDVQIAHLKEELLKKNVDIDKLRR